MLWTNLLLQKLGRIINPEILVIELRLLESAFFLIALYQCIKFHLIPFFDFRYMLQTSFILQKLRRKVTPLILMTELRFLHSALPLMALY